jgi:hypothetical protein
MVFEAGLMIKRWPEIGSLAACAQFVLPRFSIEQPSFNFGGTSVVTAPFLLFGLKVGI